MNPEIAAKMSQFNKAIEDIKRNPSIPFVTKTGEGSKVVWFLKNPVHLESLKDGICDLKCRACTKRAVKLGTIYGRKTCLPILGESIRPKNMCEPLRKLRNMIMPIEMAGDAELMLVEDDTFPGFKDPQGDIKFNHITVVPSEVTSASVAKRFKPLWQKYKDILDVRLSKFFELQHNIEIVKRMAVESDHPDHWLPTIDWIIGILTHAEGKSFDSYSMEDKMELRVFSVMTGSSHNSVHFDYHKSDSIIDLLRMSSASKILSTMNERRDEENYMIANVDKAMKTNKVTDPYTISLAWGSTSKNKVVDLDIWVKNPLGQWVSYSEPKNGNMKLNFDAGVCDDNSDNPVENVSILRVIPGLYEVRVNNYDMKNSYEDIPFQVVVKNIGNKDEIYEGVWQAFRGSNDQSDIESMIKVAEVDFYSALKSTPVVITEKKARAYQAQDPDFTAKIGDNPTSVVCTSTECEGFRKISTKITVSTAKSTAGLPRPSIYGRRARSAHSMRATEPSAVEMFKQMTQKVLPAKETKSQQLFIPTSFPNLDEMFAFVFENQGKVKLSLQINQVSPGFMVNVKTAGNVVYNPVAVHYRDYGHLPMEPTYRGPARGGTNQEWFSGKNFLDTVNVIGVYRKTSANKAPMCFVALEDAHLPSASRTYPVVGASGMYPTVLHPSAHIHRSKFHSVGTMIAPTMPITSGTAMIGGFLFGNNEEFYINDVKVRVG